MEKTHYLKDYRPADFSVESIFLTIDLAEDHAIVTNQMKICRNNSLDKLSPLLLYGSKQELIQVTIDDQILDQNAYQLTKDSLTINNVKDHFNLIVVSKTIPQANTELKGFYQAGDVFLTQCEPDGFSQITYYLDRPDILSIFTTKIIADKKYSVLLANGDKIEQGDVGDHKHYTIWHDKFKKPAHLFAAVIGNLGLRSDIFTTKSGNRVDLQIYVPEEDLLLSEYAMESLKQSMKWDEDTYGREYDLNTYMIVATPKFNMGAMENKGLNIFNTKYILASPDSATDCDYIGVHDVIGHEYFHNWTGNRITIRNWFQLTLKEGLTVFREHQFSGDQFGSAIKRIQEANFIRTIQFQEDAGPLSSPVLPDSYIKMDNFYTVTVYEKGAEIVRMIRTIIGEENFLAGMQIYFDRYDGQAVTVEEFVHSMEEASERDLSQFRLWYSQGGTPSIEITSRYDAKLRICSFHIKQSSTNPNHKAFHIPIKIGLIGKETGQELTFFMNNVKQNEVVLDLTNNQQVYVLSQLTEPPIPSLLRDFSAPVKVNYDYKDEELLFLLEHDSNNFNAWDAGQKYYSKLLISLSLTPETNIPDELIRAVRKIVSNQNLDPYFIAETISLPTESNLYDSLENIDPQLVYAARKTLLKAIGGGLQADFLEKYTDYTKNTNKYVLTKEEIAKRALKNRLLHYLNEGDKELGCKLAQQQLENCDNLTDRLGALAILFNSDNDLIYRKAVGEFYESWKSHDLVMDKFLSLQALSERTDTISRVKALLQHPAFDIATPNKIYALIRSFAANQIAFHEASGEGYKLYSDFIIELDPINREVASRLAKSFDNWRKFEPGRRALLEKNLGRIQRQQGISDHLKEIVDKILG